MRRTLLILALMLVGGGLLFWALDYNRGFVLVAVGNHLVQVSLWLVVLALVVSWLLWRGLRRVTALIRRPDREPGRRMRDQRALMAALGDYYEGRWEQARKGLVRSARSAAIPGLNYVLAADAAVRMGDDAAAAALVDTAAQEVPADSPALVVARARLARHRGEEDAALAILRAGQANHPRHPQILAQLRDALEQRQDWEALAELLPALRGTGMNGAELAVLEARLQLGRLVAFAQPGAVEQRPQRLSELHRLWSRLPKELRSRTDFLRAHARGLVALGEARQAERELRRHLDRNWDAELVLDWAAALEDGERRGHLAVAERWLREHGDSWQLLLVLGRLCRLLEVRGKSREYLERALRLGSRAEVHAELGETLGASGDSSGAVRCFRLAAQAALAEQGSAL